jgi:hypothetical protein
MSKMTPSIRVTNVVLSLSNHQQNDTQHFIDNFDNQQMIPNQQHSALSVAVLRVFYTEYYIAECRYA